MSRFVGIIICFYLAVLSASPIAADDDISTDKEERAIAFVENLTNRVFALFGDEAVSEGERRDTLQQLINENVSVDVLAPPYAGAGTPAGCHQCPTDEL